MLDTCHWSSLPQAAQLARGFHTPHSHFCAYIYWKAFFICTHPFWKLKLDPLGLLETSGFPD